MMMDYCHQQVLKSDYSGHEFVFMLLYYLVA